MYVQKLERNFENLKNFAKSQWQPCKNKYSKKKDL